MGWSSSKGWNDPGWSIKAAGGAVGTLSVDGVATGGGGVGSFTITLSTTKTNDVILVFVEANSGTVVSSISDTAGLTWAQRAQSATNPDMEEWFAVSSGILTSDVISVTMSSSNFAAGAAIAVNGADISSPPSSVFDITPVHGTTSTPSGITTVKAATIVIGAMRGNGDGAPPATWSEVSSGARGTIFMGVDYKIFSSVQTSIGIADTETGINGWIADAIKASGQ